MIETVVLFGHLVVAALIIALVLLQRGKGAEAGAGFGAGASGTVFGARGSANFFSRATAVLATLFFATSLTLAYFSTRVTGSGSLLEGSVLEGADAEAAVEAVIADPDVPLGLDSGLIDNLPEINLGDPPAAEDGDN
ncbi:MAG TPA: preprotein translocase subunit SecG [Gammaproteobacteria bacterium]|jgi:preprotein translocase subunit SecG